VIFRREPQVTQAQWAQLCQYQQTTILAIAHLALSIASDPEVATPQLEDDLRDLVRGLEDKLAYFNEHFV
jgi:hypothetical protein